MIIDILQREVEALSAEVTRLRFMVYSVMKNVHEPPSQIDETEKYKVSQDNRFKTRSSINNTEPDTQCSINNSDNNNNKTELSILANPELVELLNHLLSATKDASIASSLLKDKNELKDTKNNKEIEDTRRQSRRGRMKKHGQHHSSLKSSSLSSSLSLSRSSSASSHKYKKKKRKSQNNYHKKEKNQENAINKEKYYNISLSQINRANSVEDNDNKKSEIFSQSELKEKEVEKSHSKKTSLLPKNKIIDSMSIHNSPKIYSDVVSNHPTSLSASQRMYASFMGSLLAINKNEISVNVNSQNTSTIEEAIHYKEKVEKITPTSDENVHPLIQNHNLFPKNSRQEHMSPEVTKEKTKEVEALAQFTPMSLGRTIPAQRPSLLERLRGSSDESSTSNEEHWEPTSAQQIGVSTELRSTTYQSAVDKTFLAASLGTTTNNSGALGAAHITPSGSTGGFALEMLDEYDFALQDSFERS